MKRYQPLIDLINVSIQHESLSTDYVRLFDAARERNIPIYIVNLLIRTAFNKQERIIINKEGIVDKHESVYKSDTHFGNEKNKSKTMDNINNGNPQTPLNKNTSSKWKKILLRWLAAIIIGILANVIYHFISSRKTHKTVYIKDYIEQTAEFNKNNKVFTLYYLDKSKSIIDHHEISKISKSLVNKQRNQYAELFKHIQTNNTKINLLAYLLSDLYINHQKQKEKNREYSVRLFGTNVAEINVSENEKSKTSQLNENSIISTLEKINNTNLSDRSTFFNNLFIDIKGFISYINDRENNANNIYFNVVILSDFYPNDSNIKFNILDEINNLAEGKIEFNLIRFSTNKDIETNYDPNKTSFLLNRLNETVMCYFYDYTQLVYDTNSDERVLSQMKAINATTLNIAPEYDHKKHTISIHEGCILNNINNINNTPPQPKKFIITLRSDRKKTNGYRTPKITYNKYSMNHKGEHRSIDLLLDKSQLLDLNVREGIRLTKGLSYDMNLSLLLLREDQLCKQELPIIKL